jgi:hypothetical protein
MIEAKFENICGKKCYKIIIPSEIKVTFGLINFKILNEMNKITVSQCDLYSFSNIHNFFNRSIY